MQLDWFESGDWRHLDYRMHLIHRLSYTIRGGGIKAEFNPMPCVTSMLLQIYSLHMDMKDAQVAVDHGISFSYTLL